MGTQEDLQEVTRTEEGQGQRFEDVLDGSILSSAVASLLPVPLLTFPARLGGSCWPSRFPCGRVIGRRSWEGTPRGGRATEGA